MARRAKQYLANGHENDGVLLEKFDMLLFEAGERFKISEWEQCIAFIKSIQDQGLANTNDRKAICLLYLGRCYRRLENQLPLASTYLEVIID